MNNHKIKYLIPMKIFLLFGLFEQCYGTNYGGPPLQQDISGCFNGNSTVKKESGEITLIKNLQIGDSILVYDKETSQTKYSPIITIFNFQEYNQQRPVNYLEFHTSSKTNSHFRLTPSHLLLVKTFAQINQKYYYASQVQVGDQLFMIEDGNSSVTNVRVNDIKLIQLHDAYAPISYEGTIIVDRFVASCYGGGDHEKIHLLLVAVRMFYNLIQSNSVRDDIMKKFASFKVRSRDSLALLPQMTMSI